MAIPIENANHQERHKKVKNMNSGFQNWTKLVEEVKRTRALKNEKPDMRQLNKENQTSGKERNKKNE